MWMWTAEHVSRHMPVSTCECGLSALPDETPFLSELCERWRLVPWPACPQHWVGGSKLHPPPTPFPRLWVSLNHLHLLSSNRKGQTGAWREAHQSQPSFHPAPALVLPWPQGAQEGFPLGWAIFSQCVPFLCWVASTSDSLCILPERAESNTTKIVNYPCGESLHILAVTFPLVPLSNAGNISSIKGYLKIYECAFL